ncbi:MAG: hypothetical protein QOE65_759 [Solirubrobacteraceae bacterium]|nr:hypothetical protein [Solirubrobacteraceae bacterium]
MGAPRADDRPVSAGRGRIRRVAGAVALAAAVAGFAAAPAGAADVTVTARVGEEVAVLLGPAGWITDASTVPARVVRERRGDVIVVTIV